MLRVTLRMPLRSPLADATARRAGFEVEGYPLGRRWLLHSARGGAVLRATFPRAPAVEGDGPGRGLSLLVAGCRAEDRLLRGVDAAGAVPVPPFRWKAGAVEASLLVHDATALQELRRRMPGATVHGLRRVRDGDLAPELLGSQGLLHGLTGKQAEAILAAQRMGYYESPRRATAGDVAKALGVARSTFEEHLKHAEAALVRTAAPLLRLHQEERTAAEVREGLQHYARFSEALGLYVHLALRGERVARVQMVPKPPRDAEDEHPYLARILHAVATGEGDLGDIPVDLDVGPFEQKVLEALRRIPAGEVRTYGQLAQALGHPGAARAVGNACAKNPVPLVVPCHRVVPRSGGLGNYSGGGGGATKERLLAAEGALAHAEATAPATSRGKPR
jgi:methylated-DNA-[protein]-cysteine S-methyltransferase